MKNKKVILGIVLVGVILSVIGILLIGSMYSSLSAKDFKEHFGALGYTVSDKETPEFDTGTSYQVATKEDVPYKFVYYEFDDEVEAKIVYEKYKEANNIRKYITSESKNNETYGALFAKTVVKSENEYIVISRVRKTVVFVATTKEYTNEVDAILEEIGY